MEIEEKEKIEDKENKQADNTETALEEVPLDQDLLDVIGERLSVEKKYDEPIHQDIANRWLDVLKQGLPADKKLELIKKYPVPKNCAAFDPPKLNPELVPRLKDNVKRDDRILAKQTKIAAAIAALAKTSSMLVKTKDKAMLAQISDAARLMADVQRDETNIRRSLATLAVHQDARDVLRKTVADEWLFGADLAEALKSAKALEAPLKMLNPDPKASNSKNSNSKNLKSPPKRFPIKKTSQGGKQYSSSKNRSSKDGSPTPKRKKSPQHSRGSRFPRR